MNEVTDFSATNANHRVIGAPPGGGIAKIIAHDDHRRRPAPAVAATSAIRATRLVPDNQRLRRSTSVPDPRCDKAPRAVKAHSQLALRPLRFSDAQ